MAFIDNLMLVGSFNDGLKDIYSQVNEDKLWNMYLHSMSEKSYYDWKDEVLKTSDEHTMTKEQAETTVNQSNDILKGFKK